MGKGNLKIRYDKEVDEFDFWKMYFELWGLNRPKKQRFTPFELSALAFIMSGDIDKSPLKNQQRKELVKSLNELGYKLRIENVHTRVIAPLMKRGIIYKSEDDMANGEYTVNKTLRTIQKYIRSQQDLTLPINFNFKINGSGNSDIS